MTYNQLLLVVNMENQEGISNQPNPVKEEAASLTGSGLIKSFTTNKCSLLIVWGWLGFLNYLIFGYLPGVLLLGYQEIQLVHFSRIALLITGIIFTLYYLFGKRKEKLSYTGITIRFVWAGLILMLMFINLIQFNVVGDIDFELQHPIFMIFIGFAILVTGRVMRFQLLTAGGIAFSLLGLFASYMPLQEQLLMEAIGWMLAFIIPGHLFYAGKIAQA